MRFAIASLAPALLGACSPYLCRDRGECQAGDPLCVLCDVGSFGEHIDPEPEPEPRGHMDLCDRVGGLLGQLVRPGEVPVCDWMVPFGMPPWHLGEDYASTIVDVMRGAGPTYELGMVAAEGDLWGGHQLVPEADRCRGRTDGIVAFDHLELRGPSELNPGAYVRQSAAAAQAQPQTQDYTVVFWFGEQTDRSALPIPAIYFGSVQMVTERVAAFDLHGVRVYVALFYGSMDVASVFPSAEGATAQVWWPLYEVNRYGPVFFDLRRVGGQYVPDPPAEVCSRIRDVETLPTDETHCQVLQYGDHFSPYCQASSAVVSGGVMGVSIE